MMQVLLLANKAGLKFEKKRHTKGLYIVFKTKGKTKSITVKTPQAFVSCIILHVLSFLGWSQQSG
jgi:hypothetical protein